MSEGPDRVMVGAVLVLGSGRVPPNSVRSSIWCVETLLLGGWISWSGNDRRGMSGLEKGHVEGETRIERWEM